MQIESKYSVISKKSTYKGQICKALHNNKKCIIKRLFYSKMSPTQKQRILDEVNILTSMSSPNIIKYIEFINQRKQSTLNVIMQYCPSNIQKQINAYQKQGKKIQQQRIWKWLKDIILALQQIHKNKQGVILHRNIKPNSIFIDDFKRAKLGNFGLIRKLDENQTCSETILSDCYYMSPQQHLYKKFTQKSDIWSLGCLLFQICTFKTPFKGNNEIQILKKICDAKIQPISSFYSRQLNRVIQWCLQKDANDRPTTQDLLSVPQITYKIRQQRVHQWTNKVKAKQQNNYGLQQEIKQLKIQIQNLRYEKQSKRVKDKQNQFRSLNYETSLKKMMTLDMKRGISQNLDRVQSKLHLGAQSNFTDRFFANKKYNKVQKPAQTYRHLNF